MTLQRRFISVTTHQELGLGQKPEQAVPDVLETPSSLDETKDGSQSRRAGRAARRGTTDADNAAASGAKTEVVKEEAVDDSGAKGEDAAMEAGNPVQENPQGAAAEKAVEENGVKEERAEQDPTAPEKETQKGLTLARLVQTGIIDAGEDVVSCEDARGKVVRASLTCKGEILHGKRTFTTPEEFLEFVKEPEGPSQLGSEGWRSLKYKGFPFAVFTRQLINAGLLAMLTTAERDAGIKPSNAGKSVAAGTHEGQSAWATPTKTPKSSGVPKSAKSASTKSKPKTAAVDSSKKDSKKRKAGETPKEASSAKNKKVKGLTSSGQPPSRIACVGRKLTIIDDGNKYSAFLTTGVGKRWEIKYYEGVGTIDAQIEVIEDIDAEARNGALVIDEGPLEDVDKMYAWAAAEYNAFAQTSDPSPLPPRHATLPPPQS